MSIEPSDNAQGTLAFASGSLLSSGLTLVATTDGNTQLIGFGFVILGTAAAIFRAWLRAP